MRTVLSVTEARQEVASVLFETSSSASYAEAQRSAARFKGFVGEGRFCQTEKRAKGRIKHRDLARLFHPERPIGMEPYVFASRLSASTSAFCARLALASRR